MKVRKKDVNIITGARDSWDEAKKGLKNIIEKNSKLYYIIRNLSPELHAIACSWGKNYYKNINKYLTELSGLHLEINGQTLKDMGYKPSDKFRDVLEKLFEMKLDGRIKNKNEEINMAKLLMDKIDIA